MSYSEIRINPFGTWSRKCLMRGSEAEGSGERNECHVVSDAPTLGRDRNLPASKCKGHHDDEVAKKKPREFGEVD